MTVELDKTARRIIGVLIEKELSTPNLYPLTPNALRNGCNQKNNRNPVFQLQEFEIEGALRSLFVQEWVTNVSTANSRVLKWKHRAEEKLALSKEELPVMAELLLRGAQTAGELRSRSARMRPADSLEALVEILDALQTRGLVRLLPPTPGRRAQLYDHLLYPEDEIVDLPGGDFPEAPATPASAVPHDELEELRLKLEQLTRRVAFLEQELDLTLPQDNDMDAPTSP